MTEKGLKVIFQYYLCLQPLAPSPLDTFLFIKICFLTYSVDQFKQLEVYIQNLLYVKLHQK